MDEQIRGSTVDCRVHARRRVRRSARRVRLAVVPYITHAFVLIVHVDGVSRTGPACSSDVISCTAPVRADVCDGLYIISCRSEAIQRRVRDVRARAVGSPRAVVGTE
ncbi:hypothetical protein EVAR_80646_1 [Eumeta japonica]|uniref:Uncharacterized protein n=1 Tax=Eumeta variegata TaxID=151549 RepID=A0A4C1YQV4_EUMVA|nr:hypothetical protein EVAR_80646_1 [Eumeta japonica]